VIGLIGLSLASALGACTRDDRTTSRAKAPPAPVENPQLKGLGTPEHPVIVRLAGRREVVTVSGGPNGPVYSVADHQGRTMVSHATLDELRDRHPDIYRQIRTLVATDASAVLGTSVQSRSGEAAIMQREAPIPWAAHADR
jgi:hypothetical protein